MPEPHSIADGLSDGRVRLIAECAAEADRVNFKLKMKGGSPAAKHLYGLLTPLAVRAMAEELLLWRANGKSEHVGEGDGADGA